MAMTEGEIYGKVQKVLVEALAVEQEQVTPQARLTDDLGAESIDYLDIAFQTEKAFGITIQPNEMLLGDLMSEPYLQEGKLTDAGVEELRRRLPHVDLDTVERTREPGSLRSAFTVDALVRFITAKLAPCH
jgi:acyl carrier protein